MHEYLLRHNQISKLISLSKKMNPYNYLPCWDFDSTSSLSPLQGLSWHQPPPPPAEPQNSTPYTSLEETHTENHSNSRLHVTAAAEELAIGSVAMAEYGGEARNKKRKSKELENRNTCERKRRGRIAERIKTLEELLPNSSYKLSAASVLDKAIEYIKTLQLQRAVLGYQQMMMDGLLIPTHNSPVSRESVWDNSSDSILMANCGSIIPGINRSTHPGLPYTSDGLFSSVTGSMPDSGILPQLLQSPMPMPMPMLMPMPVPVPFTGQLFDGFGGLLASAAASSPSLHPVSLPVELVSSQLDDLF